MHTALWCLAAVSVLGAFVAAARPSHSESRSTAPVAAEEVEAAEVEVAA
jgi:hypothetical protein